MFSTTSAYSPATNLASPMSPFLEDDARSSIDSSITGLGRGHEKQKLQQGAPSNGVMLRSTVSLSESEPVYDLLCIGFGPASLAIAVALNDSLDVNNKIAGEQPDVCFLEQQTEFAWHAGMLLPGTKMQISFIKDLATLRDPRSEFTFLNYLKRHNRLVQFSNLGTFLPSRAEFQDYMRWCADHFQDSVKYGQQAVEILPGRVGKQPRVNAFTVIHRNVRDGTMSRSTARNVVIATGGAPHIPSIMPRDDPRVIHSSQYCRKIPDLLSDRERAYQIAVVGGGQSAAEIFQDLHHRYPNAKTYLINRDTALRPSDDSPFVNEVFDPDRVDHFYSGPEEARDDAIKADRSTNYSVVRLELLEQIYHDLYQQRIHQPDERQFQHRLLTSREISRVTTTDGKNGGRLTLTLNDIDPLRPLSSTTQHHHQRQEQRQQEPQQDQPQQAEDETLALDALLLATGYTRSAHDSLLRPLEQLRPATNTTTKNSPDTKTWQVRRDYKVRMDEAQVDTAQTGVWLQGCNESTHGLADSLLSTLATRGGEIVGSIFGDDGSRDRDRDRVNGVNGAGGG